MYRSAQLVGFQCACAARVAGEQDARRNDGNERDDDEKAERLR